MTPSSVRDVNRTTLLIELSASGEWTWRGEDGDSRRFLNGRSPWWASIARTDPDPGDLHRAARRHLSLHVHRGETRAHDARSARGALGGRGGGPDRPRGMSHRKSVRDAHASASGLGIKSLD